MSADGIASASTHSRGRHWSFKLLRVCVLTYLLVIVLMVVFENFLVYPGTRLRGGDWNPVDLVFEDVFFSSADGTKLHGWYLEHPQPVAQVLWCHGNGENVARMTEAMASFRHDFRVSVFVFDYRGFGRSEGRAQEEGVLADGQAAQVWLAQRAGVELHDVVILGRSLGGGVAVDLAARNGARGLILERTFTSMPDAAAKLYPWVPVKWLMRNQYDSLAKIDQYRGPLLQSHGTDDEIVEFELGKRLFAAAPSRQKQFIAMPDVGHNGPNSHEYLLALREFLSGLPEAHANGQKNTPLEQRAATSRE